MINGRDFWQMILLLSVAISAVAIGAWEAACWLLSHITVSWS